jgi:two-component system sensor histidine kinase MprB
MALHYRRSLASRVTLLATIAVGLAVAVVALAAFFTVQHQLQASLDKSLLRRATAAAKANAINELLGAQKLPAAWVGAADVKIGFMLADGEVVNGDNGRGPKIHLGAPELAVARGRNPHSVRTIETRSGDYRVATVPSAQRGVALVLAQSLQPNEETLDRLGIVMLIFGLLGVVTAGLAGWAVARNGLRPVRRLTGAVEEIARTEKLDPIAVEGNDEIARLSRSFNAMLAALSASRERQRRLVADAGHELRTPLTSLRTNLDLLIQADRRGGLSDASRAELLDDVRFQIGELTTLVGDLTELARTEPVPEMGIGRVTEAMDPVDLADVVDRAVQRVRRRANTLEFDVSAEPWLVNGDATALERAVTNLLDNAAKWSPPLGTVTVTLRNGTVCVTDQGRGIADADLPHVFERFYRSPESRTMPGSGLGLSIVSQVAEHHGGTVRAGRAPGGGAAFWLHIPGVHTPEDDVESAADAGYQESSR